MDPTKASPAELQDFLETLQEAGRVISGSNLKLLRAIETIAKKAGHKPEMAEVLKLARELIARADGEGDGEPVQEAGAREVIIEAGGRLLREADGGGKKGHRWLVRLIESGVSHNRRLWTPAMVRKLVPIMEGLGRVWAYYDHDPDDERERYPVRRAEDRVGFYEAFNLVEDPDGTVAIEATFNVIKEALRADLRNADELDALGDFLTFSINAEGAVSPGVANGAPVSVVESIDLLRSFDVVTDAAAGGRVIRLVASKTHQTNQGAERTMTPEELAKLIKNAVAEGLASQATEVEASVSTSEAQTTQTTQESVAAGEGNAPAAQAPQAPAPAAVAQPAAPAQAPAPVAPAVAQTPALDVVALVREAVAPVQRELETMRAQDTGRRIAEAIRGSQLPAPSQERVAQLLTSQTVTGGGQVSAEAIQEAIKAERTYIASLTARPASGHVGSASGQRITASRANMAPIEVHVARLRGFFRNPQKDKDGRVIPAYRTLKEAMLWHQPDLDPYGVEITEGIMESLREARFQGFRSSRRITESITTATFGEVFANVMHQVLIAEYSQLPYDGWRKFVSDIEPVMDFLARKWMKVGGYGDLPTVAESAAYQTLTHGGDEEESYSISKRGGIEDAISMEAIAGDRVGSLSRIPGALARAAKRTLYREVMDAITTDNATMADGVALYHNGSHGNLPTGTALSVAGLKALKQAMRAQTAAKETAEILGPRNLPRHLIVPPELEDLARVLVESGRDQSAQVSATSSQDAATFLGHNVYQGSMTVEVYDYLSSAEDFYAVADPMEMATMVVGFYNGQEEPELFVEDDPNSGSGFNNDTQAVKIRHIYGVKTLDHRPFCKMDVS